jgi:cysteinyl-tRNA synthetase
LDASKAEMAFNDAMDEDLDTPGALAALVGLADEILAGAEDGRDVAAAQESLRNCGAILGLRLDNSEPEERVTSGWQIHRRRFADF